MSESVLEAIHLFTTSIGRLTGDNKAVREVTLSRACFMRLLAGLEPLAVKKYGVPACIVPPLSVRLGDTIVYAVED